MANGTTLLAHLSRLFSPQTENVAVEALGYVLNKYAATRDGLDDVVRSGVGDVRPIVKVRTQVSNPDGTRPDLVGIDEDGAERVLIEAKFWADLTPRQPAAYLDRLPDDKPAVLLFLVPEERIASLSLQLRERAQSAGKTLSEVDSELKCMRVDDSQRYMLLISWTALLDRMSARTRDEQDADADIRQLRGLADFAEEERFRPIRDAHEEFGPDSRLKWVIDAATEQGIEEGWASKKGLNRTPRPHGYGRFLSLGGREVWFGVHTGLWERDGDTPLWLDCGGDHWVPIPIVTDHDGVEFPEVLSVVVGALRGFAEAQENHR